jgi:hypothetical protein
MLVSTGPGIRAAVRPPSLLLPTPGDDDAAEAAAGNVEDAGGAEGAGPPSAAASESDKAEGGTMMDRVNRGAGVWSRGKNVDAVCGLLRYKAIRGRDIGMGQ